MTSTAISTQIQLASRPEGWPKETDFRTVTVEYAELQPGQVRVENLFLSVDPYMRGRMTDAPSYVAPYALGETLTGGAVGVVVESTSDDVPVGAHVLHALGWRDIVQEDAASFRVIDEIPGVPLSLYLSMLGMTGLTAYVGLTAIAGLKEGETVFVSGAAGAVGTAVGQIARKLGAGRIIGSAGTAEKVALLTEKYGFDAAFDYKEQPVWEQLAAAAPDGIDVYFDNVGGDHLEAALDVFNRGGRAALCGAISSYNEREKPAGPDNMANLIKRALRLEGFTVGGYGHLAGEFQRQMVEWIRAGEIAYDETVVDGLDSTVQAFLDMMRGANTGKMIVDLSGEARARVACA